MVGVHSLWQKNNKIPSKAVVLFLHVHQQGITVSVAYGLPSINVVLIFGGWNHFNRCMGVFPPLFKVSHDGEHFSYHQLVSVYSLIRSFGHSKAELFIFLFLRLNNSFLYSRQQFFIMLFSSWIRPVMFHLKMSLPYLRYSRVFCYRLGIL